ncbi:hypothetical protein Plhal304r1_c066g0153521 [Plasmopara halstedii]
MLIWQACRFLSPCYTGQAVRVLNWLAEEVGERNRGLCGTHVSRLRKFWFALQISNQSDFWKVLRTESRPTEHTLF